ncbi:MAG TPA: 50S ribosomal protein L25 [Candidatus Paceibacterota bacterium]
MLSINIEKRDKTHKLDALRKAGKLPAVFYGRKEKSTPITVSHAEFLKVWKKAGESSVVELKGLGEEHESLIKEIDVHPVTGVPRHADFYVIEKGKKVEVDVPLNFVGVSPAVKDLGAILVKVLHTLKIEAGARDLPASLSVDISTLAAFQDSIKAKDIKLGTGVTLITNAEDIVASVSEAKEEVEEAPTAIDMSAIEVEKKGKEEVEGEGEAGADAPKESKKEEKK